MCDHCTALAEVVAHGETLLASHAGVYRRPMTPLELAYGDVARVDEDMDAAQVAIAQGAAPVVKRMAVQLVEEAAALARKGDVAGLSRIRASFTGELAGALKDGIRGALELGKAQARDSFERQRGTRFEIKPPPMRKDAKKAADWLDAKAEVEAERISSQVTSQVQAATVAQIAKQAGSDWIDAQLDPANPDGILAKAISGGEKSLTGTAMSGAREGIGLGRLVVFDEVKDDIDSVTYSAILDDNVCAVCEAADGEEYSGDAIDEGLASAPNDECEGSANCRCYTIVTFFK